MTENTNQLTELNTNKRNSLDLGSIVLIIGITAVVAVVGLQLSKRNSPYLESGNRAPDFTVTTFEGEEISLQDLRGNVVVVNFWASWCGPCRDEAPILQSTWEQYRDQNFVMLGLTHADVERDSRAFIEEFNVTYPNAPDPAAKIYERYNLRGVPETFVVGPDGELVYVFPGPLSDSTMPEFIDTIETLLEENT